MRSDAVDHGQGVLSAQEALLFLDEASAVLAESLDYEATLGNIAQLTVPVLADWCAVDVVLQDGTLRQITSGHPDPEQERLLLDLRSRYRAEKGAGEGVIRVIATGKAELHPDVRGLGSARVEIRSEEAGLYERLGPKSYVIVPLIARGQTIGAMTLLSTRAGRHYASGDLAFAHRLAGRFALAVDNARLYTEHRRIAHTLQAGLLPRRLPAPPGVRFAARYRAAGEFNEVGGDFYDAFQRAPDEWVVVIGDVSGKGPEAAALTALARYTIRSAALNDWTPSQVLRRLNDTLLDEGESQLITVALAYLCHRGQTTRVRLVLGGHPLPCAVRSDGKVEMLGVPGTLLGFRPDVRLHEAETVLEPGDAMVLYTDGVTDAGPRSDPFGQGGLVEVLSGLGGADPEALVGAVDDAALKAGSGRARDDVALVAVQAVAVETTRDSLELSRPAEAVNLRDLREAVVAYARDLDMVDLDAVRLAVGEACANVIVHAYRSAQGTGEIHLRAMTIGGGLVVEIRDDGCGPAPRSDSPGLGLGVPLMSQLTRELRVLDREPSGTLVRLTF